MQWVAYYDDGTHLRQYKDDGSENKYADIDRSKLASFALYDGGAIVNRDDYLKLRNDVAITPGADPGVYELATRKLLHLHLEPGQRLIYRRRVERTVGSEAPTVCYMIGWQQTLWDKSDCDPEADGRHILWHPINVQSIAYVFENGTIELAGKWREDHPWFYSVQYVPNEEIA